LRAVGGESVQAGPGQTLFPTMTRPGLTDTVLTASASAALNYNLFDVQLGRRFQIDDHFAMRGYAGFRFADITQTMNAGYNGLDANQAAVSTRSSFNGFGPILGGEAILGGWRGFHAYARFTGGLISGTSANSLVETNDGGNTLYANVPYNVEKVVPVATLAIGGGWQYRSVSLRFGYEVTQWFGLTERVRFTDDVSQGAFISRPGNLSLNGLFIQLGYVY
jgi:hypothetical protein